MSLQIFTNRAARIGRFMARNTLVIEGIAILLAVLAIIAGLIIMNMGASAT